MLLSKLIAILDWKFCYGIKIEVVFFHYWRNQRFERIEFVMFERHLTQTGRHFDNMLIAMSFSSAFLIYG